MQFLQMFKPTFHTKIMHTNITQSFTPTYYPAFPAMFHLFFLTINHVNKFTSTTLVSANPPITIS